MIDLKLRYDFAGREPLTEGLPLGNGHLGVLTLGGIEVERLVLNEGTLFGGGPYRSDNPDAVAALPEVRERIFRGEYRAAAALAEERMMGVPKGQMSYQPLGDLLVEFPEHDGATDYRRELDLRTAIALTSYTVRGVHFERELFVSYPDQVLVLRLTASRPLALEAVLRLASQQRGIHHWQNGVERWHSTSSFGMRGRNHEELGIPGALQFEFGAECRLTGGRALPGEDQLRIRGATEIVIVAAAATSFRSFDDASGDPRHIVAERLAAVRDIDYESLKRRHREDFEKLFGSFELEVGRDSAQALKSTDARVAEFATSEDPALVALYVQYARYLSIAASRAKSQPMGLQGLWNDKRFPPWGGKCTININTEMNYWPTEVAHLPTCVEPLFDLLETLAIRGEETARIHYGARGWVAHHNTDLWRATAPVDGAEWGLWPLGGAWLALHLWDHYRFSLDLDVLRRAYPILRGAALFFVDTLVVDPNTGHCVTCPSISPENQHPHGTALCAGPTMDMAILRDLFDATAEAAKLLEQDGEFAFELRALRDRLAPYRIGKAGQLEEWQEDWDMEAPERHHRHVSHLYGLYPSHQIQLQTTPELARAARRSLELRGDAATGWSLAWKLNLWARLGEGERAHELLQLLLCPDRTYPNLFDAHPPFRNRRQLRRSCGDPRDNDSERDRPPPLASRVAESLGLWLPPGRSSKGGNRGGPHLAGPRARESDFAIENRPEHRTRDRCAGVADGRTRCGGALRGVLAVALVAGVPFEVS
ncbi:MAG: glycoside hydrolase family 95 protein [Polyangiaceae bacterium]